MTKFICPGRTKQDFRLDRVSIRVRPIRRSEIGKIGIHQKIGESDVCTVRFRFACGHHAASDAFTTVPLPASISPPQ